MENKDFMEKLSQFGFAVSETSGNVREVQYITDGQRGCGTELTSIEVE
ncbi:hypothetical protein HYZ41_02890 [archaeon]|nr:hypothetical protein [archaeon]